MAQWHEIDIPVSGGAGLAAGGVNYLLKVTGALLCKIAIGGGAVTPTSIDVTIYEILPDGTKSPLVTLTNVSAPRSFIVQPLVYDETGVVTTSRAYPFIGNELRVEAAQANNGTVKVFLLIE